MGNIDTETLAKEHVIRFEARHQRRYLPDEPVKGYGYDLVTEDASGKRRFIEIKSTLAPRHGYRWLEQAQFDAMSKHDDYWIYLVLEVTALRAKIRPVHKSEWPKEPSRTEIKRWYKIPESLQKDAEEQKA